MSTLDTNFTIRMNSEEREQFEKTAASYAMSSSELARVIMKAAVDKNLRIVITKKTIHIIKGVHVDV